MQLVVAAVGKVREPAYRTLLDEYHGRIRRYARLTETELKDEPAPKLATAFDRVLADAGARAVPIALDVRGRTLDSEAFARKLGAHLEGADVPVFLVGGAEGLPGTVRARASWALSLGPMTLPHRLARVVLAEQVYRAFTILRGEPYAREGVRA